MTFAASTRPARVRADRLRIRKAAMSGQYAVESPAGPAVITRIETEGPRGGRVWEYEIETAFVGDRTRLHYGYASFAVAKRGITHLVTTHLVETGASA